MALKSITLGPGDRAVVTSGFSNVAITNNTPLSPPTPVPPVVPTVAFAGSGGSALEATGNQTIRVVLSAATTVQVTVNYAVTGGTATANADYTSVSGTLTFAPGVTEKTINLPIIADATVEANETVILALSGPINATLGSPSTYTHTILNDDSEPTPASQPVELGVNLETINDYNRSFYFTDLMKSARIWTGSVGSDGWPVGTVEYIIITTDDNCEYSGGVCIDKHGSAQPTVAGTYPFTYTGAATMTATNATITDFVRGTGDVCTGNLVVASNNVNVLIKFTAPSAGSITSNIKVMRPGYATSSTKLWTDEFKAAIAPFKVLRCMDILITNRVEEDEAERAEQINNDGEMSWSDRPSYTYPYFTNIFGCPIEALVRLANETGKDLWLNIPDYANSDYWQGLAIYLKANLNPSCKVYLEYSNEVWNGIFLQYTTNRTRAQAYITAGTTPTLDESNLDYAARHYTLKKIIDISGTFRSIFGDAAMLTRIRPVFADQNIDPSFVVSALNWAKRKYAQPPAYHLYAIASAPYSGPLNASTDTTDIMLEGGASIFTRLNRRVTWTSEEYKQGMWYGVARKHDLAYVGYEGGWDAGQGYTNLDAKIATCYDARAEGMAKAFISQSYAHGMRLFCWFNLAATYSRYGQWGLSDDLWADYPTPVAKKLKGAITCAQSDVRDFQLTAFDPATSVFGIDTTGTRGSGTGLRGLYYRGTNFNNGGLPDHIRVDDIINFIWYPYVNGNPFYRADITDNATKSFSIQWRGFFIPRYTGSHTFELELTGTAPVFTINGQNMNTTPTIALTAGTQVPLVIDYVCASQNFQALGKARLWVTLPSGREILVPQSYLNPPTT